jgi:hypothetical protein
MVSGLRPQARKGTSSLLPWFVRVAEEPLRPPRRTALWDGSSALGVSARHARLLTMFRSSNRNRRHTCATILFRRGLNAKQV